ncbi:MAG: hypothetical protein Q8L82_09365 [Nitrosomonas sp.]|nr:hypothetical protein [Nitrosomonas sp.]
MTGTVGFIPKAMDLYKVSPEGGNGGIIHVLSPRSIYYALHFVLPVEARDNNAVVPDRPKTPASSDRQRQWINAGNRGRSYVRSGSLVFSGY